MPDITVFKMEIDDSTFNAPFGGRARSDGAQETDESSGMNVKLIAGLGMVFLLTGISLAFLLKRRFTSNDDDSEDTDDQLGDEAEHDQLDDETEHDQLGDETGQEKGGIRAVIGLSFLIVSTAVVKRTFRAESEQTILPTHTP